MNAGRSSKIPVADNYKAPALLLAGTLLGILGTFFAYAADLKQIPVLVAKVDAIETSIMTLTATVVRMRENRNE